jgi:putative DNA primase/helicase
MQQFINIPNELRLLNRWVCWKMEERNGKPTKVPKNPKDGKNAMSNESNTWGSFKQAVDRCKKDKTLLGIGFQFEGSGYAGFDIDGCRDKETGELTPEAQDIINTLDSYTEVSASGKGVHVICKGTVPDGRSRNGKFELYYKGRYFVMSGDVIEGRDTIYERTEQLAIVHQKYINVQKSSKSVSKSNENVHKGNNSVFGMSDDELIKKAMSSKNGNRFESLYRGDWNGLYASPSEADMALCNMLAFWTGRDADAMDRIFRMSALFRDKWDERRPGGTYGSMTIQEAIDKCDEVYEPKKERQRKAPETVMSFEEQLPPDYDDGFDQLLQEKEKEKKKSFTLDDIGNAERLIAKFGENLRYCFPFKSWLVWDKNRWRIDNKGEIYEMSRQTARGIIQEAFSAPDEKRDAILRHARKSCDDAKLNAMIKQARSLPGVPVDPLELDKSNWLLAAENGTIDLKTGKLREHDRNDMVTKITPITYDPKGKAPTWEAFLDKIFCSDKELISFIQRAVGYSLTGSTAEQCFFMCHGTGSNGKSTLFNVLSDILGDYSKTADMELFTERRNNQNSSNEVAMLQGSRLVTTVETNDGVKLNEALVKKLTGSDLIVAKRLYADAFEYRPVFKIWMAVNHLPIIKGTDIGIWRRIRIVPFNAYISDTEKDVKLPEKLKIEYPAILRWAVEGCMQWQKQGLNPPAKVLAATEEYKQDQDMFGEFISACCVVGRSIRCSGKHLYAEYERWCEENNYKTLTAKSFVRAMREKGFMQEVTRSRRYDWVGIGVATPDDVEDVFQQTYWQK